MDRSELAPIRLCEDCARSPTGLAGHDGLRQFHEEAGKAAVATGSALFECNDCDTRWARTYCGEGFFAWTRDALGHGRTERD